MGERILSHIAVNGLISINYEKINDIPRKIGEYFEWIIYRRTNSVGQQHVKRSLN